MQHRGPDDRGYFQGDRISLGMSRLAIIDLTPSGHQPMSNPEETIWIVYNGEVYNFQSERRHLETLGYRFTSTSDTEVILRLYDHYGDDFLNRLRGIFALAIYDRRRGPGRERLLLARDHFGIKPLLYAELNGLLIFASEIKALLASGLVSTEIDPISLRLLLTYGSVYQPRTMLQYVKMLLPAHRMIVEHGYSRLERYWHLETDRYPEMRRMPYEEAVGVISDSLSEAVQMQMISDVPLGAFLSGGIDSSVLVALMVQEAGHQIKTFSVGFETEGAEIDESDDARRTAEFLGTDHHHVLVRGSDVRDEIHQIATALDQPSVDGVNSYFVSWAARQEVTVAISGTGGDEIFAGYPWFINMIIDDEHRRRKPFQAALKSFVARGVRLSALNPIVSSHLGERLNRYRSAESFLSRYATQNKIFGANGAAQILNPEIRNDAQAGRAEYYDLDQLDELPESSVIERVSGLCLRGYTSNQLLRDIDATSMYHSLEVRVPYLDHELVNRTLSLPDRAKIGELDHLDNPARATYRATGAKRILIDVGRSLLPKDLDMQPKRGFGMPFNSWLRGPLRDVLTDALSENNVRQRGWLHVPNVTQIRDNFLQGHLDWPQPWLLMMLELWIREVVENANHSGREIK